MSAKAQTLLLPSHEILHLPDFSHRLGTPAGGRSGPEHSGTNKGIRKRTAGTNECMMNSMPQVGVLLLANRTDFLGVPKGILCINRSYPCLCSIPIHTHPATDGIDSFSTLKRKKEENLKKGKGKKLEGERERKGGPTSPENNFFMGQ